MRIAILGTGEMARGHVEAYQAMDGVEVVAGIDTNRDRLAAFNETHGIPNGFTSIDEALAWGEFDAVSNVTPDGAHMVTTLPLLDAGKHVLCEKPLATSEADAKHERRGPKQGVINMVNLSYREVLP